MGEKVEVLTDLSGVVGNCAIGPDNQQSLSIVSDLVSLMGGEGENVGEAVNCGIIPIEDISTYSISH